MLNFSKRMKILQIPNNFFDGCFFYRNFLPSLELKDLGHQIKMVYLKEEMKVDIFDWADVVIFSRCTSLDPLPFIQYLKEKQKKIVYEIDDDFLNVPKYNPAFRYIKILRKTSEILAETADLITCTTPYLAEKLKRRYNKRVEVLPNALKFRFFPKRRRNSNELRIGWSGSMTHPKDLMIVAKVLYDLQKRYNFIFFLQGVTERPIDAQIFLWKEELKLKGRDKHIESWLELWEILKKVNLVHFAAYPFPMFPEKLAKLDFDIGLCPLENTEFNRSKSCVKFYEYAAVGTVTLASNVLPYKEEVNFLADNNYKDWYKKIEELIQDRGLREKLLKEQQDFVFKNRDIKKVAKLYEKVYLSLL